MISKKQIIDLTELIVIGSITTAGFFIGGTIGASVMAGLGINLASNVIGSGSAKLKSRWIESKDGILNRDIQRALLRAYQNSLKHLQDVYFNLDAAKSISKNEKKEITTFFKELQKTAKEAFIPNIEKSIKEGEIQKYLLKDNKQGEKLLLERINQSKILDFKNEHFITFFKSNLLTDVNFWFSEELKTDSLECNKAWRAFQRLLLEGIKDDISLIKTGQDDIKQELRKVKNIEIEIKKLRYIFDKRNSFEPFQTNLIEINSSLTNVAEIVTRTEKKIDKLKILIEDDKYLFQKSQITKNNLNLAIPTSPEILIGREELIKNITEKIIQGKSVSLHGIPGIGKTSLSIHLATIFQKKEANVFWLKAGRNNSNSLCNEIARRFEEHSIISLSLKDKYEKIRVLLYKNEISLIILDDVWNLSAARVFFKQSIPNGCKIIITGRKKVGIGYAYEILPLDQIDSEALFRHHSNIGKNTNVENICRMLGGHPMAIEIAGKVLWINSISVNDFEKRLKDSTNKLKTLSLSKATHENMWATFLTSYTTLKKEEQQVFCAFGALWNSTATSEILSMITSMNIDEVTNILQILISNSLVKIEYSVDNFAKYRIHDLTYDFVKSLTNNKRKYWEETALKCCVFYAQKYSAQNREDHNHIEAEINNLISSATFAFNNSHFQDVNELAMSLYERGEYLRWRGYVNESILLLENAVKSTEKINEANDKGKHLGNLGIAYRQIGQIEKSIEFHKKALDVMLKNENKEGESDALGEIGWAYHRLGDSEKAIHYLKNALNISRNNEDRRWESIWLGTLGRVYKDIGNIKEAIDCHQKAYDMMVEINNIRGQGARIGELGWDYESIGEFEKAKKCYEKALDLAQSISDNRREGVWLASLGSLHIKLNNTDLSEIFLNSALKIAKKIGHKTNEANIYRYFGELYSLKDEYVEANFFYQQSVSIYKETHQKREIGICKFLIGVNLIKQMKSSINKSFLKDEALLSFREALEIKKEINDYNINETLAQIKDLQSLTNN